MSSIRLYGSHTGSECGYCKTLGNASIGINCTEMLAEEYELLVCRGWRRSGTYFYKPDLSQSCCKLNTIRLDVANFTPNPKQQKVLDKFTAYLAGKLNKPSKKQKRTEMKANLDDTVPDGLKQCCENAVRAVAEELEIEFEPHLAQISRNVLQRQKKFGVFTMSSALKLAAELKKKGAQPNTHNIAERLSRHIQGYDVQVTLSGFLNFMTEPLVPEVAVPSEPANVPHEYSIALEPSAFTDEKFQLYTRYQLDVHHEEKDDPNKFKRFLCSSPLKREELDNKEMGCFHMVHRIDGRLVAYGVVDNLPGGLSSVYFIYEPEFKFLSLGVVGALKEIEFVQQQLSERYRYYYLGYYIDNCQKMRYKAEYAPAELLCPVTYRWVPYEACVATKAEHNFLKLADCLSEDTDRSVLPDMDLRTADLRDLVSRCKLKINGMSLRGLQLTKELLASLAPYLMELLAAVGQNLFVRFTLEI